MSKLKMWDEHKSWEAAEAAWESKQQEAEKAHPLRVLKSLPKIEGVTKETGKNLKWKSLKYMLSHDKEGMLLRNIFKHPIRYGRRFFNSLLKKQPYKRDGDFFLYNTPSVETFRKSLDQPDSILVVGFSYCHKPHECPSKRFNDQCIHDRNNPVCQQCFIGKTLHTLPKQQVVPLIIPTIHYIGEKIFDIVHSNPGKEILFIITACELTLKMFADWGNMVNIKGLGVRLDGRICNTMRAFELSEEGTKPGLTVVLPETQRVILDLIRSRREQPPAETAAAATPHKSQ